MTPTERARLIELLTKQLRTAQRSDNRPLFTTTWKALWAMGAQVIILDHEQARGDFLVVTSKGTP